MNVYIATIAFWDDTIDMSLDNVVGVFTSKDDAKHAIEDCVTGSFEWVEDGDNVEVDNTDQRYVLTVEYALTVDYCTSRVFWCQSIDISSTPLDVPYHNFKQHSIPDKAAQ